MRAASNAIEAGGATPPATVKVWDPFVRIFHWSLASLFVLAYATGDEIERVHVAAGYTIAGLLAIRIVWGSQADQQLHLVLEQIIDGAANLKTGAARNQGAMKIMRALAQYGEHFDHPGWQPLEH